MFSRTQAWAMGVAFAVVLLLNSTVLDDASFDVKFTIAIAVGLLVGAAASAIDQNRNK